MSGYTPGPYQIGRPGGPAGPFWSLVNAQGNVVAMQITSAENAALLAAAPELLEALLALDAWIRDGGCAPFSPLAQVHGGGPTEEQVERLRGIDLQVHAAIGKATGEPQP